MGFARHACLSCHLNVCAELCVKECDLCDCRDRVTGNDAVGTTYLNLAKIASSGGEIEGMVHDLFCTKTVFDFFFFFTPHHLDLGSIFSCEQCCHFFYRLLNGAFFFFPWNRGACRKYGIVVIWRFIRALLCLRAVNRVQANCLVQCSPSSLLPPRPSCYNPFSWSASVSEIPALLSKFKAVI